MKTITSENIVSILYIDELKLQILLVEHVWNRLKKSAETWTSKGFDGIGSMTPPRDILIDITMILFAMAIISRILFEGKRKKRRVRERAKSLRKLLDLSQLPNLRNLSVRNSYEHIDERLDEFFLTFKQDKFRIEMISVAETPPPAETIVFKRFDPNELSISFAKEKIYLQKLVTEIEIIKNNIPLALKKMEDGVINLWAT